MKEEKDILKTIGRRDGMTGPMFAAVWCMLKMFTSVAGSQQLAPMESNPVMAEAFGNEDFMNTYVYDEFSDRDVMDQMLEDGLDPDSLDFDFEAEADANTPQQ